MFNFVAENGLSGNWRIYACLSCLTFSPKNMKPVEADVLGQIGYVHYRSQRTWGETRLVRWCIDDLFNDVSDEYGKKRRSCVFI